MNDKITIWDVGQGSCTTFDVKNVPLLIIDLGSSKRPTDSKKKLKKIYYQL